MTTQSPCATCGKVYDLIHDGKSAGTNEYNDPWRFPEHEYAPPHEGYGYSETRRQPCPGSGKNRAGY